MRRWGGGGKIVCSSIFRLRANLSTFLSLIYFASTSRVFFNFPFIYPKSFRTETAGRGEKSEKRCKFTCNKSWANKLKIFFHHPFHFCWREAKRESAFRSNCVRDGVRPTDGWKARILWCMHVEQQSFIQWRVSQLTYVQCVNVPTFFFFHLPRLVIYEYYFRRWNRKEKAAKIRVVVINNKLKTSKCRLTSPRIEIIFSYPISSTPPSSRIAFNAMRCKQLYA